MVTNRTNGEGVQTRSRLSCPHYQCLRSSYASGDVLRTMTLLQFISTLSALVRIKINMWSGAYKMENPPEASSPHSEYAGFPFVIYNKGK
jgi:hypothetical protein